MIDMVIFDMAGTSVDEQNVVYKTLREVVVEAGVHISQEEVNRLAAGKEKQQAIHDMLVANRRDDLLDNLGDMHLDFKEKLVKAYDKLEVKPIEGIEEVFDFLTEQDIIIVLNTGYDRSTAEGLLEKLNWTIGETIDGLVTASEVENSRPHPDMIDLAQFQFEITNPEHILKIGDSAVDIEEGKNAGCGITVGTTTGAQPRELLAKADPTYIVDDLRELKEIILRANAEK